MDGRAELFHAPRDRSRRPKCAAFVVEKGKTWEEWRPAGTVADILHLLIGGQREERWGCVKLSVDVRASKHCTHGKFSVAADRAKPQDAPGPNGSYHERFLRSARGLRRHFLLANNTNRARSR